MEVKTLEEVCRTLANANVAFTAHYSQGEGRNTFVITVTESVKNEQLRTLTDLGANMSEKGVFRILGIL